MGFGSLLMVCSLLATHHCNPLPWVCGLLSLRFNPDGRMGWLCWHVAPRRQGRHEGRWNTDGEVLARSCCDRSCADVPKLSASRSRPPVPPRGLADEPCIRLSGG